VKPADDDTGDLIVRIWETLGAHTNGTFQLIGATDAELCNGLEEPINVPLDVTDQVMEIDMRPFEIQTIRIRR
jgi:hypothetical protein